MNRLAIGIFIALSAGVLGLGWLSLHQSQQIGALEIESDQLAEDLESSEDELLKQHELHLWDQALVVRVNQQNNELRLNSQISQQLTRKELKDEVCANTPQPVVVANRLQQRIHSQARSAAGSPAG